MELSAHYHMAQEELTDFKQPKPLIANLLPKLLQFEVLMG